MDDVGQLNVPLDFGQDVVGEAQEENIKETKN